MAALIATFKADRPGLIAKRIGGVDAQSFGSIVGDGGDYASGGVAVAAALFGLDTIDHVQLDHAVAAGYSAVYLKSTGKVKIYLNDSISGIEAELGAVAFSGEFPVVVTGTKVA